MWVETIRSKVRKRLTLTLRLRVKREKNPGAQGNNRTREKKGDEWRRLEEERQDRRGRMTKAHACFGQGRTR